MATGTGTVINLSYNGEGFYMNMATPLADTSYSVTSLVAGGFSVVKSRSTTTEPLITNGFGSVTKTYGSVWVADTDMYIYVYTFNGTDIFYYWLTDLGSVSIGGTHITSTVNTGTLLSLNNKVGGLYNMSSASTGTTYTLENIEVGGVAISFSRSTTTEPTVTGATKIAGATWIADTDMYLNVFTLDGTVVYYYWSENATGVDRADRLYEDAAVTTTLDIDWSLYEIFKLTLTGVTTLSDINLPASGGKTITLMVTGVFGLTYSTGWDTTFVNGVYDGTVLNQIVVQYVKSATPYYVLQISQPD